MNYLLGFVRFIFAVYFLVYTLAHVLIYLNPQIANYVVFMNLVNRPFQTLDNPPAYGLNNVHNFYLETDKDIRVGIWHYIPDPLEYKFEFQSKKSVRDHFDSYFRKSDGRPVIIYVHGNDADRARGNRIGLCKRLAKQGYHVFSIDYRGYGDSTGWPSEDGVVKDVMTLFNFIKAFQKQSQVFIWGQSLGTGISAHASKVLSEFNSPPDGVVLEAPFLNITKASKEYIIAPLFLNNRWIIKKTEEALESINLRFDTEKNILKIRSKILILHAVDDWFIPVAHSKTLKKTCEQNRPKDYPPVKYIEFHEDLGLGHNEIYTHDDLYGSVKEFIGK